MSVVNFTEKFALFSDHWSPKVIAEMNNYQFKLVKIQVNSSGTTTATPTRCSSSSKAA